MSRSQLDQFIDDDEEETCPLCVEEFDLTDKGFRPRPCGYQICQFCYHNVKNNMNGLCPACRRQYNDNDIEYKVITPEETAAHKARQAQKLKKTQAALQKEKQKAEADNLSRKHLSGMRVVQKNLVYVTGLSPTSQEDQLLQTLRGDQYFGQYGEIIKIVVSKAKDPSHPHSVGVYVTYRHKEDAASCIAAVDGSRNADRTLRAQFGTTKYCSAYLRNETCTNRNCMFLHEPGEANESYSRADLSALNATSSQHGHGKPPPPQSQQPVSAAQPMLRQGSDQPSSPILERPALPSTASWASKPPQASHAESRSTSATLESPAPVNSTPAPAQPEPQEQEAPVQQPEESIPEASPTSPKPIRRSPLFPLEALLHGLKPEDFNLVWSEATLPPGDVNFINNYPPLFDQLGGARRRLRKQRAEQQQREEEQRRILEQEAQAFQQPSAADPDDNPEMSGSLQLGGEPEERQSISQVQSAIQPPGQDGGLDQRFHFGGSVSSPGVSDRGLTPQQHQQMMLQTLKPNTPGGYLNNSGQQGQYPSSFQQQNTAPPGHHRNVSRFSFANDSTASAAVKPVANPKLMNQQSSMMPPAGGNHFGAQHQQPHGQFYTSNVQGPPPGLKTTGTPPVSGNLTFGQGHGFATGGLQYGAGTSRNPLDTYHRELLRGRDGTVGGVDAKHDAEFPPLGPTRQPSIASRMALEESRRATPPVPPGLEGQIANESRRSTPTVPPGLTRPTALPDLEGSASRPTSRPSSRASLRRTASQIMPALPLRPGTPARMTPSRKGTKEEDDIALPIDETPTKLPRSNTASDLKKAVSAQELESKPLGGEPAKSTPADNTPAEEKVTVHDNILGNNHELLKPSGSELLAASANKGKSAAQTNDATSLPETPTKSGSKPMDSSKRKHPGKLDITAAVKSPEQQQQQEGGAAVETPIESATINKALRTVAQTPSSSKVPESPSLASPAIKAAPRTLRVVQTPKAETPPAAAMTPAAAHRLPSRQPSVTSINPPGTPSSEHVSMSDNISMTSTSQSRANSPPPAGGKVGSAPVRTKTKSQQKKDRQERAKQEEKAKAVEEVNQAATEEPVHEAIVSRKKKAKKEKEPKPVKPKPAVTAETTPTASRPASPGKPAAEASTKVDVEVPPTIPREPKPATPVKASPIPQASATQSPREPTPPSTPTLSAAQLIQELKASAPEIQKCIDSLFRVSNSSHFKSTTQNVPHKDLLSGWKTDVNINLSKDEINSLLTGKVPSVHRGGEDGRTFDRHMITPSGAHLRALTKELEARFLELEKALREMPDEFRFRPAKPQNEMKLPAFDLEEMKRKMDNVGGRGPSIMEQMVQDSSQMKKGAFLVDEASKYINEFVMPPVTPPPSAGGPAGRGQNANGQQKQHGDASAPSVEVAERAMQDARQVSVDKENGLKRMIKKNKRILGMHV